VLFYCFEMLPVSENEISLRNSSGGPEHLRPLEGKLLTSNDATQMDVHKTLNPFYTTKKMPHDTVTITKKHFVSSNSQVYQYHYTTIYTVGYLQKFKAGHFFSSKHCHDL